MNQTFTCYYLMVMLIFINFTSLRCSVSNDDWELKYLKRNPRQVTVDNSSLSSDPTESTTPSTTTTTSPTTTTTASSLITTTPSPLDNLDWGNLSQIYFGGSLKNGPIFLKDTLLNAPCSIPAYKTHSPLAYLETMNQTLPPTSELSNAEEERRNELLGRIHAWDAARNKDPDPKATRKFEESTCYRQGEYLECVEGKCQCPQSGNFKKLRYQQGLYVDMKTGAETPNTAHCLSPYGAYCVRNSRTCSGGGRCMFYGGDRPFPWTKVRGICRNNMAQSKVKSASAQTSLASRNTVIIIIILVYFLLNPQPV